jgi:phage shock protein C
MDKKLYRDDLHKTIGGVCAGLAEYFSIDVAVVRIIFVVTLCLHGGGLPIYIILWIALPKKPLQMQTPFVDYTVPPSGANPYAVPPVFNQPKQKSTGTIIAGAVLLVIGMLFILDDFNIMPDWDMEHFWPLILIVIGVVVIFSGKKQPWNKQDWHKAEEPLKEEPKADNSTNDNPTTI